MSRGYLIFAYNNETIDYGTMALCNSLLIKKHCKEHAVALVTSDWTLDFLKSKYNKSLINYAFDEIIISGLYEHDADDRKYFDTRYSKFNAKYYNSNRYGAYQFSPFDETILLDADYLILDNSLDLVWGNEEDFLCNKRVIDLDHKNNNGFDSRFNDMSIPLYWATAVYFRKTEKSKAIFDHVRFVKDNYDFYRYLYNFNSSGFFRNDYAMSISIHLVNRFMEYDSVKPLPVDYIRVSTEFDEMHDFDNGNPIITTEKEPGQFILHRVMNNVHIMNKLSILRNSEKIITYART